MRAEEVSSSGTSAYRTGARLVSVWCWRRSLNHKAGHVDIEIVPGRLASVEASPHADFPAGGRLVTTSPADIAASYVATERLMNSETKIVALADVFTFCVSPEAIREMRGELSRLASIPFKYQVYPIADGYNCATFSAGLLVHAGVLDEPALGRRPYHPGSLAESLHALAAQRVCTHKALSLDENELVWEVNVVPTDPSRQT